MPGTARRQPELVRIQSKPKPHLSPGRGLAALLILMAGAVLPALLAGMAPRHPVTRDIHIEAYRYGFSPARIHANRGDRLRLTFSTRDTGQSFFCQDYDLHVSITPGSRLVAVRRLSHPDDAAVVMETVEIVAGLPGWQGWLVSKSQFRNHTYNGPLHGTERGELIVAPNFLLYGALGLLGAIPLAALLLAGRRLAGAGRAMGRSSVPAGTLFRSTSAALIPIGLACWIAFALATVLSMITFVGQSLSDPFNWGWNLLGMAGSRWHIVWAPAIPWLQVACVLVGAAFSLSTLYRCWLRDASPGRAIAGSLPPAAFLWTAAAAMIWFFAA